MVIVDRLGRRILLLTSQFVVMICTFSLGYYFYMKEVDPNSVIHLGWLPIASLCLFIISFSLGLGPVPWLMLGELFAPDVKGFAGSLSATSNWTLAFIVTKTFNNLRDALGIGSTFWLFTGLSLAGIVFIFLAVPETKGKSLASIQKMLDNGETGVSGFGVPLMANNNHNNFQMIVIAQNNVDKIRHGSS